jgi:hypothetical protein
LLILLLSESLIRLSEAAWLLQEDIVMKGDMMTAFIRPKRLREVECPVSVIEAIGGWVLAQFVSEGYSAWCSLVVMEQYHERAFELVSERTIAKDRYSNFNFRWI